MNNNSLKSQYPVIILGAGAAGVSAALGLLEAKIESLLIEQDHIGGQLQKIPGAIPNFALNQFASGSEAQKCLASIVDESQIMVAKGRVTSISADSTVQIVLNCAGESQSLTSDYLIFAPGLSERRLTFTPAHLNQKVFYHLPDSDLTGKTILIVGGGDSALLKAIRLAKDAEKIYIVHRSSAFKARPDVIAEARSLANIEIHIDIVDELLGSNEIDAVRLKNGPILKVDMVLVKAGYVPNSELVTELLELDGGYVIVNSSLQTSLACIYAAGDITAGTTPRIATALGQGMAAASAVISKIFKF